MSPLALLAPLALASTTVVSPTHRALSDASIDIELPAPVAPSVRTGLMLESGLFHGDEVPSAKSLPTNGWLALTVRDDQMVLATVDVTARASIDPFLDDVGASPSGVEVTAQLADLAGGEPLLLLHGLPLQPGPVAGEWPAAELLTAGTSHLLPASAQTTRLVVTDGDGLDDPDLVDTRAGVRLMLLRESADGSIVRQELDALPSVDLDGGPYLLWAGDLDGDHQADLLLELDSSYNRSRTVLMLSSMAEDGDLVGIAAELDTTGC